MWQRIVGARGFAISNAASRPPPPDLLKAPSPVRLDRLLSSLGLCTRSQAKAFVKNHNLELRPVGDGDAAAPGSKKRKPQKPGPLTISTKVDPADVMLDGEPLPWVNPLNLLLHKPEGCVCSHNERGQDSCFDLLPPEFMQRSPMLSAVGRLDKMASGLLLLTQCGPFVHALTSPVRHLDKVYEVTIEGSALDVDGRSEAAEFASGDMVLRERDSGDMVPCKPAKLEYISDTVARITLREGRYHQLRRMMASLGHHVVGIHRVEFGGLQLGDLESGSWRALKDTEVLALWESAYTERTPKGIGSPENEE